MMLLATILGAVLFALALLHAYWGVGGVWPGVDQADLARRVAGFKDSSRSTQSPVACFLVAAALCFCAIVALVLGGIIGSPFPFFILGPAALLITLVFLGRGVAGYTSAWRRLTPVQPFAQLDRLFYSPLCLVVGAGFFTLGIRGFSA